MKNGSRILILLLLSGMWSGVVSAEKISLRYDGAAQFEIRSPAGRCVMIDVALPDDLKITPGPEDILLTTHRHPDHWDRSFQSCFPGEQLFMNCGPMIYPDVEVFGIPSLHHPKDPVVKSMATNWIFLVVTGGLRIVHFGDIGQERLNDEQVKRLGRVDIAIMQFVNPRSDMTIENQMGFKLMLQISPRLIIPTSHAGLMALQRAKQDWQCFATGQQEVMLDPAGLPAQTSFLVIGHLADLAMEELAYKQWR